MANSTNLNNPETTTNAQIQGAGLILPSGVNERDPNKISTLFTPNSSILYSKFSPYPQGESGGFFGSNQPYIVTNINDANKGLNSTLKWVPYQPSALIDVVRVTKFSVANPGIKFLLKQVYLQGYQPFNETKIYNPLMPIQSAARVASFGILDRPIRHIEPNLGGVLGALGVKGIAGAFGFNPPTPPPKGTAQGKGIGAGPLSNVNPGDGKGLTRGATASRAYNGQNYSYLTNPTKPGFLKSIGNFFKSSTLFGAFFTIGQPAGTTYKGDDQTYTLMLYNKRIVLLNKSGTDVYGLYGGIVQRWDANSNRADAYETGPSKFSRYLNKYFDGDKYSNQSFQLDVNSFKISDGSKLDLVNYNSYESAVGINGINAPGSEVSDILFLYTDYISNNNYPTKLKSTRKIDSIKHTVDSKKVYTIETGGYINSGILDSNKKPVKDSPIIKDQYDNYKKSSNTDATYPTKLDSLAGEASTRNVYSREKLDQIKHTTGKNGIDIIETGGYIKDTGILDSNKKPVNDSPIITNQYNKYKDPTNTDATYPTKLTSLDNILAVDNIYNREQIDEITHIQSGQGYKINPNGITIGYEDTNVDPQTKTPEGDIKKTFNSEYVIDDQGKYPTTFIKGETVFGQEQIDVANTQNQQLKNVLQNYNFVPPTDLNKLRGIIDSSKTDKDNQLSYFAKYRIYEKYDLLDDPDGKGFAGVNRSDLINVLNVQSNTDAFIDKDLIKFYFYDVYNQKYIPFRATVKSINERSVSSWDDFQYVGNADKVYNYKGFTRSLSFGFTVVAMSLKEMLPMWKRINYLMGLSKPSGYKNGFIVPPLVMITIGDIYKDQPLIINSIGMTIPDNATWETISDSTATFEYLNGRLKTKEPATLAQFPREVELNIDANILEKEKPKVGINNFGDPNKGSFSSQLAIFKTEKEMLADQSVANLLQNGGLIP